jgi:hypothetical protein
MGLLAEGIDLSERGDLERHPPIESGQVFHRDDTECRDSHVRHEVQMIWRWNKLP